MEASKKERTRERNRHYYEKNKERLRERARERRRSAILGGLGEEERARRVAKWAGGGEGAGNWREEIEARLVALEQRLQEVESLLEQKGKAQRREKRRK